MFLSKYIHIFFVIVCTFIFAESLYAQEKAYPKNGEGITLFLKRFNRSGEDYQRQFTRLNKGRFGKNNSLRTGVKYILPPLRKNTKEIEDEELTVSSSTKNYQSLFGKAFANYQVTSTDLKGACFYLVSGHGGPDPGAIGKMGTHELHEDEYAYDIMLRLARNLLMRGAKVHIIIQDARDGIRDDQYLKNSKRETCMGSPIPFNQVARLEQRCVMINSLNRNNKASYKRAIFIHVDSRSKHQRTDVFFYHQPKNRDSKRLAKTMKSTFEHKYSHHQPGRGFSGTVDERNLYVLKHAVPTSVFVELGNIQNQYDQQRIILNNNRQALANWLCEGFMTDYNYHKKGMKR